MANLFDDANAPETEPATIVAGDQVKWKRTDLGTDYPNTAYSLRYSSRLEGTGSTMFDATSADSGDAFDLNPRLTIDGTDARLILSRPEHTKLLKKGARQRFLDETTFTR